MSDPGAEPSRSPRFFPLAASFYLALAVTGVVGLGLARGRLGLELVADSGGWWIDLGLGLGAGATLLGLWEAMRRLAAGPRRVEAELAALIGELTVGEAAAIALVSAIAEEIAFRGAFQEWVGWIPSALLFGLLHLGPGRHYRWWTAWSLVGGLGLGLMVDQRGSLGAAIVAHLVVNGVQLQRLRRPVGGASPGAAEPQEPSASPPAEASDDERPADDAEPPAPEDDDPTRRTTRDEGATDAERSAPLC